MYRKDRALVFAAALAGLLAIAGGPPPEIHWAAFKGHLLKVQLLVRDDPDLVNARSDTGQTPLHKAAWGGHVKVARFLLSKGADVNAVDRDSCTPLHAASWSDSPAMVELLLEHGADVNKLCGFMQRTPLHDHLEHGTRETAQLVLDRNPDIQGTDINGDTPLHCAAEKGYAGIVQTLLSRGAQVNATDDHGQTPLHEAAREGHLAVCQKLLAAGAEFLVEQHSRFTPLHEAAFNGRDAVVRHFFEQHASFGHDIHDAVAQNDLDAIRVLLSEDRDSGNNLEASGLGPLHIAAALGYTEAVEMLLEAGAQINQKDKAEHANQTPLHYAARCGRKEMVELLLDKGADLHLKEADERQPLHFAVTVGRLDIVRLLISKGANVNARGMLGMRPIQIATARAVRGETDGEMIQFLIDHGADPNRGLDFATTFGDIDVLERFLAAGANLDTQGYGGFTALHSAAVNNDLKTVVWLLEHGADPNVPDKNAGWNALHHAAAYSNDAIIHELIAHGARIDATGIRGATPLHVAAQQGNMQAARALLESGANPNARAEDGSTPLSVAESREMKELLIKHGGTL